jgi:ATPase family associated with various cellular activities (AAA)
MNRTIGLICERVRLRSQRASRFMEGLWQGDATSPDQGLAISSGEVRRMLVHPDEMAFLREEFEAADPVCAELAGPITDADVLLAADANWRRLIDAFALTQGEADLLCAMLAVQRRPELGRVFAYLVDDSQALLPSLHLAGLLFEHDTIDRVRTEQLERWKLAVPMPALLPGLAGWRADPAVLESLECGRWCDPQLPDGTARLLAMDAAARLLTLQPNAHDRALGRLRQHGHADLAGLRGSGRSSLALQLAAALEQPMLQLETMRLVGAGGDARTGLIAGLRMARHEGALACFVNAAAARPEDWQQVQPYGVPVVRCFDPSEVSRADAAAITLAPLALAERLSLWDSFGAGTAPSSVTTARITAGEIARLASDDDDMLADEPVPELLTRMPMPYDWDDLILPPDTKAAIADFAQQVRLRGDVLQGWGFDRLTHLGSGLVCLFAGPSGVGKTMAAQVLARELGLQLFRIDLAGVVDKYIGETEKKLRTAFAFAERPGVLLMFDEADALFSSRTQGRDSHDRYVNLEINYLLQRIESFEGVAVLATNRKSELDAAFRRRLRMMIDFLNPGPVERLQLWQTALPAKAPDKSPLTEGIDFEQLADGLNLTGADIKAAALGAAFLARTEGSIITMRHVLAATQRELAKHGQAMRLPLAEAKRA